MQDKSNRSDVDRLGDIRAEIKRLQAEEGAVRERILAMDLALIEGDEYIATLDPRERRSLDTQAVINWYGEKELARFMRVTRFDVIYVTPKERGK